MLNRLRHRVRRFIAETHGSYSVEAMLVLPVLIWANIGTYAYFDAFNTIDTSQKAAYTVADAISRQTQVVTPGYIDGMNKLFDYLNNTRGNTWLRVTSVNYDSTNNSYHVLWSYGTHGIAPQNDVTINQIQNKLPNLAQGDTLIVVETHLHYVPPFQMGLTPQDFNEFIATQPRLAPQVVYSAS